MGLFVNFSVLNFNLDDLPKLSPLSRSRTENFLGKLFVVGISYCFLGHCWDFYIYTVAVDNSATSDCCHLTVL